MRVRRGDPSGEERAIARLPTGLNIVALLTAGLAGGCAEQSRPPRGLAGADAARGLEAIQAAGCGACHAIPGVRWPRGAVGGPLDGFAGRSLIAGALPNQPDILVAFLRDPPALKPQTAMPPSAISEAQARDIAAYLYTLDGR